MRNNNDQPGKEGIEKANDNSSATRDSSPALPDSNEDKNEWTPEKTTIDLPEVKDIPGQEFVHAAPLGELADTTISSADEEGEGLFEEDEEQED